MRIFGGGVIPITVFGWDSIPAENEEFGVILDKRIPSQNSIVGERILKRNKGWRFGVVVLASSALLLGTSAATSSSAASKPSGQLIMANAEPISAAYYDPASAFGLVDAQLASLVFDTLLKMNKAGTVSPNLATSYKQVSKTEVDVVVRTGVTFSDGSALTPADVAASIDRIFDPKSTLAGALLGAPGKATVSGNTVKIVTVKPFGALLNSLAVIAILPVKDITNPNNFKVKPTGSGPYTFVSNANNDITVTANPNYWGTQPLIKTIILRYIEDTQARQSALLTGQVDISTRVGPQEISGVKGNDTIKVISGEGPPSQIISIWRDSGPLKNVKLRQALLYAIDRNAIAATIQGGMNPVPNNGMPTNMPFYRGSAIKYTFNPKLARTLLKAAGYNNTLKLTMATSSLVPKQAEIDQAIVGYLKAVGVSVKVTQLEVGKFRSSYSDYDMSLNTIATFNDDPSFSLGLYGGGIGKAIFGCLPS
jgi:peptide/nickel transport system substrate-binding protein